MCPSLPRLPLSSPTDPALPLSTAWPSHNPFLGRALSALVALSSNDSTQARRRSIFLRRHGQTTLLSSRTRVSRSRSTDTTIRTQLVLTSRVWLRTSRVRQKEVFSYSTPVHTTQLALTRLPSNGRRSVRLSSLVNTMRSSIWRTKASHLETQTRMLSQSDTSLSKATTRVSHNLSPRIW